MVAGPWLDMLSVSHKLYFAGAAHAANDFSQLCTHVHNMCESCVMFKGCCALRYITYVEPYTTILTGMAVQVAERGSLWNSQGGVHMQLVE